jgi:hypothetical protein
LASHRTIQSSPLTPNETRLSFASLQKGDLMAYNPPGHRSILSRLIAGMILTGIYCFSLVGVTALVVVGTSSEASARGGGRGGGGRGGGRGVGRGRGRGGGVVVRGGGRGRGYGYGRGYGRGRGAGCVFNPIYGRVVCY